MVNQLLCLLHCFYGAHLAAAFIDSDRSIASNGKQISSKSIIWSSIVIDTFWFARARVRTLPITSMVPIICSLLHSLHSWWQEAQLSPRNRAMRRVSWNLTNCHATLYIHFGPWSLRSLGPNCTSEGPICTSWYYTQNVLKSMTVEAEDTLRNIIREGVDFMIESKCPPTDFLFSKIFRTYFLFG